MDRPTTHRWLLFYTTLLLVGIGVTALHLFRAMNQPGSGGYVFLGLVLIAMRAGVSWGIYARKLWGWHANFGALYAIPLLKGLIVLESSKHGYSGNPYFPFVLVLAAYWLGWALPNTLYFRKRKYLFDDGTGPYKWMFGNNWQVLDPAVPMVEGQTAGTCVPGGVPPPSGPVVAPRSPAPAQGTLPVAEESDRIEGGRGMDSHSGETAAEESRSARIQCAACGASNKPGARFCGECGHALLRQCPECGAEDSSAKRFCTACGTDVEGFLGAQELLARMAKHAAEKEWSRVLQEAEGFKDDTRLPGGKGAELRAKIAAHVRYAANALESNIWANLVAVDDAQLAPLRGTYRHRERKFFGGFREETRNHALAKGSEEAQAAQKAAVGSLGLPLEVKSKVSGIAFRLVPAGGFTMGSPANESGRNNDEKQRQVTISQPFYCGKYPVTQGQWKRVMGSNPSHYYKDAGSDAPVESVSWEDCQAFLKKLCELEEVPRGTYRLLTEAQWEYVCRAGTVGEFAGNLNAMGWYYENRGDKTHPVGKKEPNAWGLHDMHGNVWEWCSDWYGDYGSGSMVDPTGPSSGSNRVCRGGAWSDLAQNCRSAYRSGRTPGGCRLFSSGFRLQLSVPEKGQEEKNRSQPLDLCSSADPSVWA